MANLNESEVARAPFPRFKEWTHGHHGLEFTLPFRIPHAPINIALGPFNYEREQVQMVRCITADLLHEKNRIAADVIQPAQHRGLLIIANQVSDLVHPNSLRSGLEILRTVSTPDFILCFHIIDL